MLDERFSTCNVLERRKMEWNEDDILKKVNRMFSSLEYTKFFKLCSCKWNDKMSSFSKFKTSRKEDMKKSLFRTIEVIMDEYTKNNTIKKKHKFNIQIPILCKDQYFYIGGSYKIPNFQLYDMPVLYKIINGEPFIKFKNNLMSFTIRLNKKGQYICTIYNNVISLKKNIPFELIICSLFQKEEFIKFWKTLNVSEHLPLLELKNNCVDLWNSYKKEDIIRKLGEYRTTFSTSSDLYKKGVSIITSIELADMMDFFTQKFIQKSNFIFEIISTIHNGPKSDMNLSNKRIRFSEYIYSTLLKNIYNIAHSYMNNGKKLRYKISQSVIMDVCNVSDIINQQLIHNPIGEVASLLQCTLTGPGNFKKDSVPSTLKNLHESHYKILCPADTPDRDGCGVVLNITPSTMLDKNGRFIRNTNGFVYSYPINFTPFLKNDESTRLQMASNQLKQSLYIKQSEPPMIKTGCENTFLEYTSFITLAKDNGFVLHIDKDFMVVKYKNEKLDFLNIGPRCLYMDGYDEIITDLKEKQKFNKGDIICKSVFIKGDEACLGKNLLTGITIWEGYNYEDSIVINERIKDIFKSYHIHDLSFDIEPGKILLSLKNDEYLPLPKIGTYLTKGEIFAKIKHIDGESGLENINLNPKELTAPENCKIIDIKIFPKSWNKQVPEFSEYINNIIHDQNSRIRSLKNKLIEFMSPEDADIFIRKNNLSSMEVTNKKIEKTEYKIVEKKNIVTGIRVKITAVQEESLEIGCKISNRHGAKGVCGIIIPDSEMPKLEDGRTLDIICNPLGIISRMNLGQLFELEVTETLHQLKLNMKNMFDKGIGRRELKKYLKSYLLIFDKTDEQWPTKQILKEFKINSDELGEKEAIDKLQIIQPAHKSIHPKDLFKASEYVGVELKKKIIDPTGKYNIENKINCGYVYFTKLVHRSSNKLVGRSIGPYNKNTLQPLGGKNRGRAHRLGEMEIWSFLAHGSHLALKDFLTTNSDSPGKKNKFLYKIINNDELVESAMGFESLDETPQSFRLLESYLKLVGIELKN